MKNANLLSRGLVVVALASVMSAVVGCAKEKSLATSAAAVPATVSTTTPKTVADFFTIKVGEKSVRMQLAVRALEMQRGLMERRDLGRDDGMIFVYEKPQEMSFWMRNTPTALDIGFFDAAGVLQEIYPMHPFDEQSVSSRGKALQYALEMNQGWYASNGVKPGAKLDLKALGEALKARGFQPKVFGL